MALAIKKAVKFGAKLRMALYGPSGSGKTYTALSIAREMAGDKRVIVIDTERGSASKYADIFDFDVIELENFHPHTYIEAIKMAVQAKEYSVLVIDSATHEWDGSKGALELAGQNFINWAKVTPLHNSFTDAMLSADIHVIATMRAKEEYVMGEAKGGKKNEVRSVGVEPIQRKGIQYEFDVVGSLDIDNTLTIVKTRCSALLDGVFHQAGKQVADILKGWLSGAPAPASTTTTNATEQRQPVPQQSEQGQQQAQAKATEQQISSIQKFCQVLKEKEPDDLKDMPYFNAKKLIAELSAKYKEQRQGQQAAQTPASEASHPTSSVNAPEAKDLRKRSDKVLGPGKFDAMKVKVLEENVPDDNLTPEDCGRLKRALDIIEERRAAKAS